MLNFTINKAQYGMKVFRYLNEDEYEIFFISSIDTKNETVKLVPMDKTNKDYLVLDIDELNTNTWKLLNSYNDARIDISYEKENNTVSSHIVCELDSRRLVDNDTQYDYFMDIMRTVSPGFRDKCIETVQLFSNKRSEIETNSIVGNLCNYFQNLRRACRSIKICMYFYDTKANTRYILEHILSDLYGLNNKKLTLDDDTIESIWREICMTFEGAWSSNTVSDPVWYEFTTVGTSMKSLVYSDGNEPVNMEEQEQEHEAFIDQIRVLKYIFIDSYELHEYDESVNLDMIKLKHMIVYSQADDKFYIVLYKEMSRTDRLSWLNDNDSEAREIMNNFPLA